MVVVVSIHYDNGLTPLRDEQLRVIFATVNNRDESKATFCPLAGTQRYLDRKALSGMLLCVSLRSEWFGVRQSMLAEFDAVPIRDPLYVVVKFRLFEIQTSEQYSGST